MWKMLITSDSLGTNVNSQQCIIFPSPVSGSSPKMENTPESLVSSENDMTYHFWMLLYFLDVEECNDLLKMGKR